MGKWRILETTKCVRCREAEETPVHLLNDCPALDLERRRMLDGNKTLTREIKFLRYTKSFDW